MKSPRHFLLSSEWCACNLFCSGFELEQSKTFDWTILVSLWDFFVGFILTNRQVLKPAKMKIAKRTDTIMTSASRSTIETHALWLMWRRICVASRELAKTNWIWLVGLGRPLWLVLTEVMLKCAIANEWTSTTKIQLMVNKQKSITERESLTPPALESITLRARANKWTEAVYINYANVRCRAISMNICNYEHNFVIDV